MKRSLVLSTVVLGLIAALLAGCGGGGSTTDASTTDSDEADSTPTLHRSRVFKQYYNGLIEQGVKPAVARCYRTKAEGLSAKQLHELEEVAAHGMSAPSGERVQQVIDELREDCVGGAGALMETSDTETQEAIIRQTAQGIGRVLKANGAPKSSIECLTDQLEEQPYRVIQEMAAQEGPGWRKVEKLAHGCGLSELED
jgi:hypothetical protein